MVLENLDEQIVEQYFGKLNKLRCMPLVYHNGFNSFVDNTLLCSASSLIYELNRYY